MLGAAEAAVVETAAVARAGYRETPTRENALFNPLSSFAATSRRSGPPTCCGPDAGSVLPQPHGGPAAYPPLRARDRAGFAAGAVADVSRDESLEPMLAVPFGIGMGLTLDESALLLELEDVYWTQEGLLSVQITLSVIAVLASLALGLRFLRRGEHVVLEHA